MASIKSYAPEFKARVVIEAIKSQKGKAEICSEYKIPATNLVEWVDKALKNLHQVFVPESEHLKKQRLALEEIEQLQKIIGEITVENCFLKKKLQK